MLLDPLFDPTLAGRRLRRGWDGAASRIAYESENKGAYSHPECRKDRRDRDSLFTKEGAYALAKGFVLLQHPVNGFTYAVYLRPGILPGGRNGVEEDDLFIQQFSYACVNAVSSSLVRGLVALAPRLGNVFIQFRDLGEIVCVFPPGTFPGPGRRP